MQEWNEVKMHKKPTAVWRAQIQVLLSPKVWIIWCVTQAQWTRNTEMDCLVAYGRKPLYRQNTGPFHSLVSSVFGEVERQMRGSLQTSQI